jgi:DNA-binding transcriptional ArsR family regulator
LDWFGRACRLPGKNALVVALALWHVAGLERRTFDLKFTTVQCERFGGDEQVKGRALDVLEGAGLISTTRERGKNPWVTLILGEGGRRPPAGFISGPIPLSWLTSACKLPGRKVLVTALAVWHVQGLRKRDNDLELTKEILDRFGVGRPAKKRALDTLEGAGLVEVARRPGLDSLVSIRRAELSSSHK